MVGVTCRTWDVESVIQFGSYLMTKGELFMRVCVHGVHVCV